MPPTPTIEALLDLNQIAAAIALPPDAARILLDLHDQRPAAQYRGKLLWLREAVDAVLPEVRA